MSGHTIGAGLVGVCVVAVSLLTPSLLFFCFSLSLSSANAEEHCKGGFLSAVPTRGSRESKRCLAPHSSLSQHRDTSE